ncbi:MAG: hypothetical protein DDT37_01971 [Firmicutes bacterium]|nr:hypothetical protein [candidate division NPL-UPA2 bacterium]
MLLAQKGVVRLLERQEIPVAVKANETNIWLLTQQLVQAMETDGEAACAKIVKAMPGANHEHAKMLAYRLFTIAERKGWAGEAFAYNSLVVAWPDVQAKAMGLQAGVRDKEQTSYLDGPKKR